jgi:hypothetical protein
MEVTNKQFAIIGIILLSILQLAAYAIGFDGQLTVLIIGVITYLFGVVTGQQVEKTTVNKVLEANQILSIEKLKEE